MRIDFGVLLRSAALGAVLRAIINVGGRYASFTFDKQFLRPLGMSLPFFVGIYFVYYHAEQDVPPSVVGGALAGLLASVAGLFVSFQFRFSYALREGPNSSAGVTIGSALVGGALGGLAMLLYRRYRKGVSL